MARAPASNRLDRPAKVLPDLLAPRPGHLVRAARRLAADPVVPLRDGLAAHLHPAALVARVVRHHPAVLVARVVRHHPAVLAARLVARLRPVALLVARLSTVPVTRSAARPARASCR